MKRYIIYTGLVMLIITMSVISTTACPNCKDAFSSGPEAAIGESYSWSILFMLGMFMSVLGVLVY